MTPAYQVVEAQETKRLPPRKEGDSELCIDHLTLSQNGQQILVTCYRRPTTPIPKSGETLEGELGENDRFDSNRRKFKRSRPGGGGGGFRKRDPGETWAIQRQHSQEMALRYVAIKAALGKVEEFDFNDLVQIINWFEGDLRPEPPKSELPLDDDGSLPPAP